MVLSTLTQKSRARRAALVIAAALLTGIAVDRVADAQEDVDTFYACLKNDNLKSITINTPRRVCPPGQSRVSWNERGPQGLPGLPGAAGPPGPAGTSAATTGERTAPPGDNDLPMTEPGTLLGSLPLSPGGVLTSQSYVITANVTVGPAGGPIAVSCELAAGDDLQADDTTFVSGSGWTTLVLETAYTQSVFDGQAAVRCHQSAGSHASWGSVRITAVEVTAAASVPLS
jgi:hypothetical protein